MFSAHTIIECFNLRLLLVVTPLADATYVLNGARLRQGEIPV